MKKFKSYHHFLKDYKIINTKQRELILNILDKTKENLTAEEIFLQAKDLDDTISLSTIYRTLSLFDKKKITIKMSGIDENSAKYKLNQADHTHFLICLKCNKKIEVNYCPLSVYEDNLKEEHNFEIVSHKLEIYGYCDNCKN